MSEFVVKPAVSRREKSEFLYFPWTLYRNDPNWVPPLLGSQKEMLGYKFHPFYDNNQIQTFVAYRRGEVCGRIAAILNQAHFEKYHERRGYFGFFEAIDNQDVAKALFDAARSWLAERDVLALRGPMSPAMMYEIGLLIDGFDSPPTFMMAYNPPYYARLLDQYGFHKVQDLFSYMGYIDMLPQVQAKLGPIAEQVKEYCNVHIRPLNRKRFTEDIEAFINVLNRSLVNHWGYIPMSPAEVRYLARGLRYLIVPELAIGAEIDGKLVGAVFGLPDYNVRIKKLNGRLFPFGFVRLLHNKAAIKRIRLLSTNVIPEYQRMGVALCLMSGLLPKAMQWGIQEAEFSWVAESNSLSRGSLEKGGTKLVKTFRVYDLD